MLELTKYIQSQEKRETSRADISLSGMLEVFVGNYYVSGEGTENNDFHWLTIYYDPDIDTCTSAVKMVPANIVAYVSSDYRWGFVLSGHIRKFSKDISNYEISCIPVPDFECELLQCAHTDLLPCEFSRILWLNDDFMDDEKIPFDYGSFALIDEGAHYLNPKHFSVTQLIRIMEDIGG